jgi:hypothetical protein
VVGVTAGRLHGRLGREKGVAEVGDAQLDLDWIAYLFEVAGTEGETLQALDGCLARLRAIQDAKQALLALSPADIREAVLFRRRGFSRGFTGDTR